MGEASGHDVGRSLDDALASALTAAVASGDLALVARIVAELEARRRDAAGVVVLPRARERG